MELQEANLARLLSAAGLPREMHSRMGSGSSSSPCTPAMQRAHFNQVNRHSDVSDNTAISRFLNGTYHENTLFLGFGVLFWVSGAPMHTNFEKSLYMIF